ncbi:hypothetical protein WMC41_16075 [Shinella yambaruensis]|uniref:hypothetical protein n=1 Tax=Shinella yambaruensis TaxID=415996 RepID=UPI003D78C48E
MSRPDLPADEITRAAQWLADIARWPDEPADLLVHRFSLKYWQAKKAVDKAKRMKLYRQVHA